MPLFGMPELVEGRLPRLQGRLVRHPERRVVQPHAADIKRALGRVEVLRERHTIP